MPSRVAKTKRELGVWERGIFRAVLNHEQTALAVETPCRPAVATAIYGVIRPNRY
jgi:hypothetical protein